MLAVVCRSSGLKAEGVNDLQSLPVYLPQGAAIAKDAVGTAVGRALGRRTIDDALEVVTPALTKKAAKQAVAEGRATQSGLAGRISVTPDARTLGAAEGVSPLVDSGAITKKMTNTAKAGVIKDEVGVVAEDLEKQLTTMDVTPIVDRESMRGLYNDAMRQITEGGPLTGDAAKYAQTMLKQFESYLPKQGDITAVDILKARKKLDSWIKSQRKSTIFDPQVDNAISIALRAVRQNANALIAENAPGVAVAKMLKRQSQLYDALDMVSKKAVNEIGSTRMSRFAGRFPRTVGAAKGAAKLGLIGAGLGAVGAPAEHLIGSFFGE